MEQPHTKKSHIPAEWLEIDIVDARALGALIRGMPYDAHRNIALHAT